MQKPQAVTLASNAAAEKKATEVKVLKIQASFTDYFILATGLNRVHTKSLADYIEETLAEGDFYPFSREGYEEGEWILLDYLDFVVHVFTPEARDYYQLERLWQRG
jgi:ribosome-associated protein